MIDPLSFCFLFLGQLPFDDRFRSCAWVLPIACCMLWPRASRGELLGKENAPTSDALGLLPGELGQFWEILHPFPGFTRCGGPTHHATFYSVENRCQPEE